MKTITPNDILENGTKVKVRNMFGHVISYEVAKDQFGGDIVVHTIEFTKKMTHRVGIKPIYKNINKISAINYSGVYVI